MIVFLKLLLHIYEGLFVVENGAILVLFQLTLNAKVKPLSSVVEGSGKKKFLRHSVLLSNELLELYFSH